jgi:hypothetical protein
MSFLLLNKSERNKYAYYESRLDERLSKIGFIIALSMEKDLQKEVDTLAQCKYDIIENDLVKLRENYLNGSIDEIKFLESVKKIKY